MDKFYVLNKIFEEFGLVLITDFFPFKDFPNSSELRVYLCIVFTVLRRLCQRKSDFKIKMLRQVWLLLSTQTDVC